MHDLPSHFARSTEAVYLEREGRFVWLNPPAAALWGGSPEQFAGRLVSDFLVLPAAALANNGTVVERTLRRIDGTSLAVRCVAGSLDSEAGAALLVFVDDGRVRGISAERALADAIGEGVIGVDENHRVVFANPTACALLDRDEDAMLGRKLDDVVAAVTAEGLNLTDASCPAWCQVAEGQTFQTDSWTFLRADGCRFPVSLAITPLSGDGPERGAVMTFQDTTRRKLAESALTEHAARLQQANAELAAARDAAQRFRLALDASQDAMLLIDRPSMRFLDANESAYRQMGYTREELLAMGPHDIKPEYDRKRLGNLFDAIIASPAGSGTLETTHRRKDGSTFPVEVNLRALTLAGRPALIAVVRDVTLRKQGEEMLRRHITELARANSELARTNAELDQFTYVASHDLQEPLRKVMAFSDWLRRDMGENLPESADKDLRFICDATRRMQNLVQDLLTLSRTGRISMSRATFPLAAAVEAALDTLSVNIEESGATVVTDPLPEVNGDLSLIIQLFQNLVGNALKYVEEGVRPQVFIHCGEEGGVQVFGVRDHGIGLKPEYAEQIFEPFKRLHGRGRYEGTGIGLAICRKIVQRHGGRIWVESNEGEGAYFRFTLGEAGDTPKLQG